MSISPENFVDSAKQKTEIRRDNIDVFLDRCFKELVQRYVDSEERDISNFESMASKVGTVFELYFETVIEELYDIDVVKDVELPDACMVGSGAVDAVLYNDENMVAVVELKGNPKEYRNYDDELLHEASKAGLQRSDTAKKAVCQAYQSKSAYPQTQFFLVSNVLPKDDSASDYVLDLAEGDIIDKVIDAQSSDDIQSMIDMIKNENC